MTELERVKQEIKMLQSKLSFLEELEKHKTPAEEAFKEVYGHYPVIEENNYYRWDGKIWFAFQKGYEAAQAKDAGEYQPPPQTPEEVAEGLRNAMIQAKKDGVFDEPKFTELPTLYEIIADWWDEIFLRNNEAAETIESLVDTIEEDWFPVKDNGGDRYACGWNDCLEKLSLRLK